jgi:hypothetical protein
VTIQNLSPKFVSGYRTMLCGLDVSRGDNPWSLAIVDHGVVDAIADKEETELPAIAAARDYKNDKMDLSRIHAEFNLVSIPSTLLSELKTANVDPVRKGVLEREIKLGDVQLRHLYADVIGQPKPTFDELVRTVRGTGAPRLSQLRGEITSIKQSLTFVLAQMGIKVRDERELRPAILQWKAGQKEYGQADEAEVKTIARKAVDDFVIRFKDVAQDVPGLAPYLSQLDPHALELVMTGDIPFDAALNFNGGTKDGKPTLSGRFEWNVSRPAIAADVTYISKHEGVHWLNASLMDLRRRNNLLGAESALLTMATPRAILEEGLAQTMQELMYGGLLGVLENLGPEVTFELLYDQLQDVARLTASVGENIEFASITDDEQRKKAIHDYVTLHLLQSDKIGAKFSKPYWRKDPVGICYSFAYYYGSRILREAVARYGVKRVLSVATHSEGLCDIQAFQQRVRIAA